MQKPSEKLTGYDFYKSINSPKYVCAPMVDQSELAFRMLARKHGTELCYTPMLHSRLMSEDKKYFQNMFSTCPEDQPLFTQLCGNDPEIVLKAAQQVQNNSNAVDINLGCPQAIAKKGNYGSFLQEKPDIICSIVRKLDINQNVPVTCKIRLLPKLSDTIDLAKKIEQSGASILTVHGRTKEQNKQSVGQCNWEWIKAIKDEMKIPVFANGGIYQYEDVGNCMEQTGVDGVMSSESLLENPALFSGEIVDLDLIAEEYLELWSKYETKTNYLKPHLFKILHSGQTTHTDLRAKLGQAMKYEDYYEVVQSMKELRKDDELLSKFGWYERYWEKDYKGNDRQERSLLVKRKKLVESQSAAKEMKFENEELKVFRKQSREVDQILEKNKIEELEVEGNCDDNEGDSHK